MRKLQREPQKHDGSHHPVRDMRRPSWADADKLEAEVMTPRARLQRLLFEHRTAHDPASSEREIVAMFEAMDNRRQEAALQTIVSESERLGLYDECAARANEKE